MSHLLTLKARSSDSMKLLYLQDSVPAEFIISSITRSLTAIASAIASAAMHRLPSSGHLMFQRTWDGGPRYANTAWTQRHWDRSFCHSGLRVFERITSGLR